MCKTHSPIIMIWGNRVCPTMTLSQILFWVGGEKGGLGPGLERLLRQGREIRLARARGPGIGNHLFDDFDEGRNLL